MGDIVHTDNFRQAFANNGFTSKIGVNSLREELNDLRVFFDLNSHQAHLITRYDKPAAVLLDSRMWADLVINRAHLSRNKASLVTGKELPAIHSTQIPKILRQWIDMDKGGLTRAIFIDDMGMMLVPVWYFEHLLKIPKNKKSKTPPLISFGEWLGSVSKNTALLRNFIANYKVNDVGVTAFKGDEFRRILRGGNSIVHVFNIFKYRDQLVIALDPEVAKQLIFCTKRGDFAFSTEQGKNKVFMQEDETSLTSMHLLVDEVRINDAIIVYGDVVVVSVKRFAAAMRVWFPDFMMYSSFISTLKKASRRLM